MNKPGEHSSIALHTGSTMPVMGLGTWKLTEHTGRTVAEALERGYRMIDTSGDYGTQPGVGKGLRDAGVERQAVFLVTKVEETDDAYEASRRNRDELDTDYVDLMLLHRPPKHGAGIELWEGLLRAREEGLARDIGVSNYDSDQVDELIEATGEKPVVNQLEWSPFGHSDRMRAYCRDAGIVIQAYSPLTRQDRLDDPVLRGMARRYGKSPAQVLIRWNLQNETVPLPKANQSRHLAENIDVFDFALSEEDMQTLDGCNERYSALGTLPYS